MNLRVTSLLYAKRNITAKYSITQIPRNDCFGNEVNEFLSGSQEWERQSNAMTRQDDCTYILGSTYVCNSTFLCMLRILLLC